MTAATSLFWIKLIHTAVWAVMASVILSLPVLVVQHRFDLALAATVLVGAEGVALGLSGGACPLTAVAARYTLERGPAFDIFLPELLARWNKAIFGTLFLVGQVIVFEELLRSGDRVGMMVHLAVVGVGSTVVAVSFVWFTVRHGRRSSP